MDFNSHTDQAVAIAVNVVNALTPGEARGKPYAPPEGAELAELIRTTLGTKAEVRPDDAAELTTVAGWLRTVFQAVDDGELDVAAMTVNELLRHTRARPYLERHDGEPWHLHFHGPDDSLASGWGAGSATGVAVVLGSEFHDRLGVCTAPRCDRVYVDTSRNGTRRFCSTACQNRVKAAAFRARR